MARKRPVLDVRISSNTHKDSTYTSGVARSLSIFSTSHAIHDLWLRRMNTTKIYVERCTTLLLIADEQRTRYDRLSVCACMATVQPHNPSNMLISSPEPFHTRHS